ncbi:MULTISPECIES: DUF892 family protein [Desulfosediminicola]|uniref:DUF892 family protein n=1 Tax=Desulfosediminicola TaxID=2886823 RepID=UPI0010AD59CC|nr:ferritin family protein [Desulfosediminicola ganghwensis]
MFRITDIHTIAIQIEKNGEISYQQAAAHATNPKIKAAFEGMAEEERRHRHWFEGFQATHSSPPEHQELEAMGRSLLQSMITNQPFGLDQNKLNQAKTIAEIITQSKAFEEDTILFYQFLRSIIEEEDVASQLDTIIEEEKLHAERLKELVEACA